MQSSIRDELKDDSYNLDHLSLKQQAFIKYYFELNSPSKAAIKAGYSEKRASAQASQLMSNNKIKMAILAKKQEISKRVVVTYNDKLTALWQIAQQCISPFVEQRGEKIVVVDRTHLAIKAIEVLNQMQGHCAPAQNLHINVNSTIEKLKQCAIEYKDH